MHIFKVVVSGDKYEDYLGRDKLCLLEKVYAVHAAHAYVGEDNIHLVFFYETERVGCIFVCCDDFYAVLIPYFK